MLCYTVQNFNEGTTSYTADFSSVLYLVAIDRCLQKKITKL